MKKASLGTGSSALLRSRRRDSNVKPNRQLDRSSSRGMIFENEELRLRTININAEVEKGQNDIKKLRRENELLRKDIWALREECDRLMLLLQEQGHSDPCNEGETSPSDQGDEETERIQIDEINEDTLSVVQEESEESIPGPSTERQCVRFVETPVIRLYPIQPNTVVFHLDLPNLTPVEVIRSVGLGVEGVRLQEGVCYLTMKNGNQVESLVAGGLHLRGHKFEAEDVSKGTVVLGLAGVPHTIPETQLLGALSDYGHVIGRVESRVYLGADTGERLVRIKPSGRLPSKMYLGSCEVIVRVVHAKELEMLSRARKASLCRKVSMDVGDTTSSATAALSMATTQLLKEAESRSRRSRSGSPPAPVKRGLSDGDMSHRVRGGPRDRRMSAPSRGRAPSIYPEGDDVGGESLPAPTCPLRRKLSDTGRETGKLPWCACWGNGCI